MLARRWRKGNPCILSVEMQSGRAAMENVSFPYFCAFRWWHHCLKWSSSLVLRQCLLDPSARRQWCDVEKICILDEAWVLVSMNHLLAVSSMLMNQQYMVFAIEYLFFSGRNTLIFFWRTIYSSHLGKKKSHCVNCIFLYLQYFWSPNVWVVFFSHHLIFQ